MIYPSKSFWNLFKQTNGALSCAEAIAITSIAYTAPNGEYLELGSHHGKSGMAAAYSLGTGVFTLVDPIFEDEKLGMEVIERVASFSPNCAVGYIADYSTNIMHFFTKPLSYVFVDSGDHDETVMQEVKMLEDKLIEGGIIGFHDFDSQFLHVRKAYDYLVSTGKYEPIEINWDEIIKYVDENNLEEGNKTWHHTELKNPCFVGALRKK